MRSYRIDSKVMRHLVPHANRAQAKAGEITATYFPGVTVKRFEATGKYFAYIERGATLPSYFTITEVDRGHASLRFTTAKQKKQSTERSDGCPASCKSK